MLKKIEKFFINLFLFPLFGGITTIAGIVAGYLGSLWVNEIKDSFFHIYYPTSWLHVNPPTAKVFDANSTIFWIIAIFAGLSLSATFWAQTKSSDETNRKLHKSLDNLLTLPPRDFLITYSDFLILSNSVEKTLPSPVALADLELAVRMQLSAICAVCAKFDATGVRTDFAANIMMFLEAGSSKFTSDQPMLQGETRCIESGVAISNLRGVLRLELNLSATATSNSPDLSLRAMSLPVPMDTGNALIYVPGAPLAFAAGQTQVYQIRMT
jgi:hypothetical protein